MNQARIELIKLTEIGLLEKKKTGNIHLFYVNKDSVFFNELASIVRKSSGFEKAIEKQLKSIEDIEFAFIFGSFAEGKFRPDSDIDIMIIGKPDIMKINEAINKAEKIIGRSIQYVVYPLEEFKKKRNHGFVNNVMKQKKIFLIGESDGLE